MGKEHHGPEVSFHNNASRILLQISVNDQQEGREEDKPQEV